MSNRQLNPREAASPLDGTRAHVRNWAVGAYRESADLPIGPSSIWVWKALDPKVFNLRELSQTLLTPFNELDPDDLRFGARIGVWARWFVGLASLLYLAHGPEFSPHVTLMIVLGHLALILCNGSLHVRLWTNRRITWHWLFGLSAMDVALTTIGTIATRGFDDAAFLLYYPALALFAIIFTSPAIGLGWVTAVAATYVATTLLVGPGLEPDAGVEGALFVRVVIMYAVVACVNLASWFEKARRRQALDRERELLEERIELSQTIHDTVAQSAYLVSVGIESARDLAAESDDRLRHRLEATLDLSQSAAWEIRHLIDAGLIAEGLEFSRILSSHISSFTSITAIPARLVKSGHEPALPAQIKGPLFAIAHNAMTNVLRHSAASQMTVALSFGPDGLRLSVADNGKGLPDDYLDRGHGFRNMLAHAERIGGSLDVASDRSGQGTSVSCFVPLDVLPGGK